MKTLKRKADGTKRTSSEILRDMGKLIDLYEKCMANSDRLIEAAKILENSGFYPQAFFLALTAWEEIGKAQVSLKNAYLERKVVLTTDNARKVTDATISYDVERGKELAKWREHALYVSMTEWFCRVVARRTDLR